MSTTSKGNTGGTKNVQNTRTQQQVANTNYINTVLGSGQRSKPSDTEIKTLVKRVQEVAPDWQEEDVLHVLEQNSYNSALAASAILDGSAGEPSQWHDVNKRSVKPGESKRRGGDKPGFRREGAPFRPNDRRDGGNYRRDETGHRRDDLAAAAATKGPRQDGQQRGFRNSQPKAPKTFLKGEPVPEPQTLPITPVETLETPKPALEALSGVQNADALHRQTTIAAPVVAPVAAVGKQPVAKVTNPTATAVNIPAPGSTTTSVTAPKAAGSWGKPPSSIYGDSKAPATAPIIAVAQPTTTTVVPPVVTEKSTQAAPISRLPAATTPVVTETKTVEPTPAVTHTESKWPTQTSTAPVVTPSTIPTSTLTATTTPTTPAAALAPGVVTTTTTTTVQSAGPVQTPTSTVPVVDSTTTEALPAARRNDFGNYSATSNLLKTQWKPKDGAKTEPVVAPVVPVQQTSTSPILTSSSPPSSSSLLNSPPTTHATAVKPAVTQPVSTAAKVPAATTTTATRPPFVGGSPVTLPAGTHHNISSNLYESHFGQFAFGSAGPQTTPVAAGAVKKTENNSYNDVIRNNRPNPNLNSFELGGAHDGRAGEHTQNPIESYAHEANASTITGLDGDNVPTPTGPYSGYMPHGGYGMPYAPQYGHFEHDMRYYDSAPYQGYGGPQQRDLTGEKNQDAAYDAKYSQEPNAQAQQQPGVQNQPQQAGNQVPLYQHYAGAPYYYGGPPYGQYPTHYGTQQSYPRYAYGAQRGPYGPMSYQPGTAGYPPYNPEEMGSEYKQPAYIPQHQVPHYGNVETLGGKGQQGQIPSTNQNAGVKGSQTYSTAPSAPPSGPSTTDLGFNRNPTDQYKTFPSHREQSFYNVPQQQFQHQGYPQTHYRGGHPSYS